ncbi:MAG: NADPH-dependent 7-cyano-7-deazaguanine reductase QueF [Acidobacteria bacterium]|nr:NADPH-dependent 7-cyano-7-deazaguanine reductase QueF [Acidobacteriota bacterium]
MAKLKKERSYTEDHARAGINAPLPKIECWENQFPNYEVAIEAPEYTSVCPKTGLPDFGTIRVSYVPGRWCVELKSFKEYLLAYRNLGIFYENATNRILQDFVKACDPITARVEGRFTPRGGISTTVVAEYTRKTRL